MKWLAGLLFTGAYCLCSASNTYYYNAGVIIDGTQSDLGSFRAAMRRHHIPVWFAREGKHYYGVIIPEDKIPDLKAALQQEGRSIRKFTLDIELSSPFWKPFKYRSIAK